MKIVAISFTERGAELIEELKKKGAASGIEVEKGTSDQIQQCFENCTPLLFVGACGIAVRLIAPCLKDKLSDPPVLVMDEGAEHVIPVLSGHMGGANELAHRVADILGAAPVITTASDVNGGFAIDSFARENRLSIRNKDGIRKVTSRALKGEPIRIRVEGLGSDERGDGPGIGRSTEEDGPVVIISREQVKGYDLWLSPKEYVLGIGCKKGKSCEEIESRVEKALKSLNIIYDDIYAFGSVDLKADEPGLLEFSEKHRIPFVTFSAELLEKAKGEFSASEFVKEKTGVDNVCERAAMLLTGNRGLLALPKQAWGGVTVAVAQRRR